MNVGYLCTRPVATARPDESIVEAARRMAAYHVGALVVVEEVRGEERPIGIVTDRDLVVLALAAGDEPVSWSQVRDAMSQELVTARESDDVARVLKEMKLRGVRRMPVVDALGVLVGIVTADDVLMWLAEQMHDLVGLIQEEARREWQRLGAGPRPSPVGLE